MKLGVVKSRGNKINNSSIDLFELIQQKIDSEIKWCTSVNRWIIDLDNNSEIDGKRST